MGSGTSGGMNGGCGGERVPGSRNHAQTGCARDRKTSRGRTSEATSVLRGAGAIPFATVLVGNAIASSHVGSKARGTACSTHSDPTQIGHCESHVPELAVSSAISLEQAEKYLDARYRQYGKTAVGDPGSYKCDFKVQDKGKDEFSLLSGDEIDVVFEHGNAAYLIEVKSVRSNEVDFVRGVYQCVKYRAVFQAQRASVTPNLAIHAILAVEGEPSGHILALAKNNSVRVKVVERA